MNDVIVMTELTISLFGEIERGSTLYERTVFAYANEDLAILDLKAWAEANNAHECSIPFSESGEKAVMSIGVDGCVTYRRLRKVPLIK